MSFLGCGIKATVALLTNSNCGLFVAAKCQLNLCSFLSQGIFLFNSTYLYRKLIIAYFSLRRLQLLLSHIDNEYTCEMVNNNKIKGIQIKYNTQTGALQLKMNSSMSFRNRNTNYSITFIEHTFILQFVMALLSTYIIENPNCGTIC